MSAPDLAPTAGMAPSLLQRAKSILVHPRAEWQVIDGETATIASLYRGYVIPLSAIPPVATFIGMTVFGVRLPFAGSFRVPLSSAMSTAVLSYVLGLVGVFVFALLINGLAPTFAGRKDQVQALKVAAYGATASWVAGIAGLIPNLSLLAILGLYSLYLVFTGLSVLMKVPEDRALGYTAAIVVSGIVLFMGIGLISNRFVVFPASPLR